MHIALVMKYWADTHVKDNNLANGRQLILIVFFHLFSL